SRWISSASSSVSSPTSPTCRNGATSACPDEYGNRLSSTNACRPRCTTSSSSGSQKTQPGSSSAWATYSSRHGAQRGFGIPPSLERAGARLGRCAEGSPERLLGSAVVGDREVDGVRRRRALDRAVDEDGCSGDGRESRRDVARRRGLTGEPDRLRH